MKRVVVTGMGIHSALGHDWSTVLSGLKRAQNYVQYMPEWCEYDGLNALLGAPANFSAPSHYTRKQTRSMGRVSLMAVSASEQALSQAGLLDDPIVQSGAMGVAYGSSSGTPGSIMDFGKMLVNKSTDGIQATTYIKMMSHTAAVNISLYFGLQGRLIPTSSACTSGSQAIGYAVESIRSGKCPIMLAGGSEELCATQVAVFDTLFATSTANEHAPLTPRPFDQERDGLVIGEGACTLVLEDFDHAKARGATMYAEVVGFGSNVDGCHVTKPQSITMAKVMDLALSDAKLNPSAIGYCSAHGTATQHGDVAESQATSQCLGSSMPISSMKSYIGHTLGACGAIEAYGVINMMHEQWFHPSLNLENVDPACGDLDYITEREGRCLDIEFSMTNNFAFGGINTSLIFKRL